jgi:hypothetical protein
MFIVFVRLSARMCVFKFYIKSQALSILSTFVFDQSTNLYYKKKSATKTKEN